MIGSEAIVDAVCAVALLLGTAALVVLWRESRNAYPEGAAVFAKQKARWFRYWRRVAHEVAARHPAHPDYVAKRKRSGWHGPML